MARYDTFQYGDGTLWGNLAKSTLSADPFTAVAVGRDVSAEVIAGVEHYIVRPKVRLDWALPSGNILAFRVVRNQEAYSEHEEDGHVIVESFVNFPTNAYDYTGVEPLAEGKYAYYTVWLLKGDTLTWIPAATTWCLIPREHGVISPDGRHVKTSARKFLEVLPRVFTTEQQSYLDEVDETSDLARFLSGFSYSLDETLTYADLLTPSAEGSNLNPNMVDLELSQLGMPKEPILSMRRKKSLIRNAIGIHKNRGTLTGLSMFARSLTGFNLVTVTSENVLLSPQDSTFYTSTGSWQVGGAGTLTATTEVTPEQNEPLSVDRTWSGKFVTTDVNATMSLGTGADKTLRIPVNAYGNYMFMFYLKGDTSSVGFSITWYDLFGNVLSTTAGTSVTATSSWSKVSLLDAAPATAQWASVTISFASAGTYYVDMVSLQNVMSSTVPDYHEARAVDLTISPTKVNYLENPSFNLTTDTDDTDWAWSGVAAGGVNYGVATTAPGIFDGSHMLELTTDGATPFSMSAHSDYLFDTNTFYTFSIYASTTSGTENLTISATVYDEFGDVLVDESGTPYTNSSTPAGGVGPTWKRYQVTVFVPNTTENVYIKVEVNTGTAPSNGNILCFDAAQLEDGYIATDYFDGTYASQGAYWTGTPNDSTSVLFRNKAVKMDRLVAEINNYLPLNCPWTVSSGIPGTYVLEASGYSS